MKKAILLIIIFCTGFASGHAQTSGTTAFDVNGIKVIFKPTSKNVVDVRLYFRGGVTNYPPSRAGIEDLAISCAVQCGTNKYPSNTLKDSCDAYGISLSGASGYDYGYVQLNCISKYFNTGWNLFADVVLNPVFEENRVMLAKNKLINASKTYLSRPDNQLHELVMRDAFVNTSYAVNPVGTEETLSSITSADLKNYYRTLLNKNKLFIVVVGNVTKQDLYEKILANFDNIPAAPYEAPDLKEPVFDGKRLITEDQQLKINYVGAIMNAPQFGSMDYVPFRLATSGLGGNLYQYLRSMRNLTYNPSTSIYSLRMPYFYINVSTNSPQEVMDGIVNVLRRIQTNGYDDEWLTHIKNTYITSSYINDQSASAIAYNLGQAEILGNWQYADDLPQLVNMVTVEQMNRVINTYVAGLKWYYLGNQEMAQSLKIPQ